MPATIHPTAIVANGAKLGADVTIGPYCLVGSHAVLADRVELISHVVVEGHTSIGEGTQVFPFASLGHAPQDKKFAGEITRLAIGARNVIREHVTMNPGTAGGGGITRIGDDCLFMASSHVAHDCVVGNQVILANHATLAGHVEVGDGVIIGGLSAVHQFVRIGAYAFIGGMTGLTKDLIPFGMVMGDRGNLEGLNLVGLKRRNVAREEISQLRAIFKQVFYGEGTLAERAKAIDSTALLPSATLMLSFITSQTSRSFCTPAVTAASVEAA